MAMKSVMKRIPHPIHSLTKPRIWKGSEAAFPKWLGSSASQNSPSFQISIREFQKNHGLNSMLVPKQEHKDLRVLILSDSFNSMAQRTYLDLIENITKDVRIELAIDGPQMLNAVKRHDPQLILCPFLTKRIPEEIWKNKERVCLIVHPGIHGDRGSSSIDWALKRKLPNWGVTVLQADQEMDAGDIWATKNLAVPNNITKSGLYGGPIIDAAIGCINVAIQKYLNSEKGFPLDYNDPSVKGTLNENMKLSDRMIDFNLPAEDVASHIRYSDSSPGAPCTIDGQAAFVYDAYVDADPNLPLCLELGERVEPGSVTGKHNDAIRIACGSGSIWITALKGRGKNSKLPKIKLPATKALSNRTIDTVPEIPEQGLHCLLRNVSTTVSPSKVATIRFPFLNGAMSTEQCKRLTYALNQASNRDDIKVIVLAGGEAAWSNGINLNTIEASNDPRIESLENINAINDFVKAIFSSNKVTVAALQGNAGAGGAMAAMACDYVWAHENTVLNPHYKTMGLHGSEYWTYFLPRRVGEKLSRTITEACMPISAKEGQSLGMIDKILSKDKMSFLQAMEQEGESLAADSMTLKKIVDSKLLERTPNWYHILEGHRAHEIAIMRENFSGKEYENARKAFVYKTPPRSTPLHLMLRRDHHGKSLFENQCNNYSNALSMDGRKVALSRRKDLAAKIDSFKSSNSGSDIPNLAILMVNGNSASEFYIQQKQKTGKKIGISTELHRFDVHEDKNWLERNLIECVESLNIDDKVNGIIVQLPLPHQVNKNAVLAAISPEKDVDGFSSYSLGSVAGGVATNGHPYFIPCTAKGMMAMIDYYNVPVLGKKVCIIGRSTIVGLPTKLLLMQRGATVTTCDINTTNLKTITMDADIIVAAAGSPSMVKSDWIKPGAVVIDAGFHALYSSDAEQKEAGQPQIVGDVDAQAMRHASVMTPVPGGVGPMTVQMLLENTFEAFVSQHQTRLTQETDITEIPLLFKAHSNN